MHIEKSGQGSHYLELFNILVYLSQNIVSYMTMLYDRYIQYDINIAIINFIISYYFTI